MLLLFYYFSLSFFCITIHPPPPQPGWQGVHEDKLAKGKSYFVYKLWLFLYSQSFPKQTSTLMISAERWHPDLLELMLSTNFVIQTHQSNQLKIFMKMRKWVYGYFMTTILVPLIHILPISLAVDRNPQSAAGESRVFLKTGLICFLVRGDNLPQFASDFSKIMTCVFLSQLTTGCSWEDYVHSDNWISLPTDNLLAYMWE